MQAANTSPVNNWKLALLTSLSKEPSEDNTLRIAKTNLDNLKADPKALDTILKFAITHKKHKTVEYLLNNTNALQNQTGEDSILSCAVAQYCSQTFGPDQLPFNKNSVESEIARLVAIKTPIRSKLATDENYFNYEYNRSSIRTLICISWASLDNKAIRILKEKIGSLGLDTLERTMIKSALYVLIDKFIEQVKNNSLEQATLSALNSLFGLCSVDLLLDHNQPITATIHTLIYTLQYHKCGSGKYTQLLELFLDQGGDISYMSGIKFNLDEYLILLSKRPELPALDLLFDYSSNTSLRSLYSDQSTCTNEISLLTFLAKPLTQRFPLHNNQKRDINIVTYKSNAYSKDSYDMQSSQPVMAIWSLIFTHDRTMHSEHVLPLIEMNLRSLLNDYAMLDTAITIAQGPDKDPYQLTYLELGLIAVLIHSNIEVNLDKRQYHSTESFLKALLEYQNQESKEIKVAFIALLNLFKERHSQPNPIR